MDLKGKVALVTGAGFERGIGRASSLALARLGATVIVTDLARPSWQNEAAISPASRDEGGLHDLVAQIKSEGGAAAQYALDVSDEGEVNARVAEIIGQHGGIDVLFNNAGTPAGLGPFLQSTTKQWEHSFNVNVIGMVNVCRAAIPSMIERGGGSIVNTASIAGITGVGLYAPYVAAKHAVVGLTRSLANEFGKQNIRVNCVCPGIIDTVMNDAQIRFMMDFMNADREAVLQYQAELASLNRTGKPEEVAEAVAWLASSAASYVTGAALPVSGYMRANM